LKVAASLNAVYSMPDVHKMEA